MTHAQPLRLFEGYGVELEYMIVHEDSLDALPIADKIFESVAGTLTGEADRGALHWSNELVLHVIELKTNGPVPTLAGLAPRFARDVLDINRLLQTMGARLMPTAMHPWMNPDTETRLWPHDCSEIYEAFDRIFRCTGHGWSNVQSVHLNLPFGDDDEFGRLHAAIRLVLPLLPALAASSPIVELQRSPFLDARMDFYRTNARRIPSVSGRVIPEPVFSEDEYRTQILKTIYDDLSPFDPDAILRDEWVNARGAIARFVRNTIEIRVIDVQECPKADVAIVQLVAALVQALVEERWCSYETQKRWAVEPLEALLRASIRDAEAAQVGDANYLSCLGVCQQDGCSAHTLWIHLAQTLLPDTPELEILQTYATRGTLARRIVTRLGQPFDRKALTSIYRELCLCLAEDRLFDAI
ncbi:MAG TPA: glutamate-cysteine ligase family protein [Candidatus Hydrogenedentes bacterium]|nr:glutamate-cysteine ligase family protein [Candidatus Hydrogenedentota bacterium]